MASKKFYRWALTFNILTSLLSVLFSLVAFKVGEQTTADGVMTFVYYVKRFFDLLAVFTGYGTIMYAFTRYDFACGVKATGIFSISIVISFIWQVVGSFIGFGSDFLNIAGGTANSEFILLTIFYSCGYCFITQFIPALFVAFCTHFITKKGTDKQTLFRLRLIATCIILAVNVISIVSFNVLPFLSENSFMVTKSDLTNIILEFVEAVIIYGPIQFGMYYLTHYLYGSYTDKTQEITTNSKKKNKTKKEISDEK
jgi:hypothetical protein